MCEYEIREKKMKVFEIVEKTTVKKDSSGTIRNVQYKDGNVTVKQTARPDSTPGYQQVTYNDPAKGTKYDIKGSPETGYTTSATQKVGDLKLGAKKRYSGQNTFTAQLGKKKVQTTEKSPVDDVKVGLPADSYKVQKGDNIARIYKKFKDTNFSGYSMRDAASMLMDINPEIKDPNMIYPGMVIKMPFQYMDPRTKTRIDRGADYGEKQAVGETATSGATSAGAIATNPGNGFANGGPGTLTRMGTTDTKKKKKKKVEGKSPHKKGTKKYKAHMAAMHAG